jgi:hypothetical protein
MRGSVRRSATPQSRMHGPRANRAIIFGIAALLAVAIGHVTNGAAQTGYDRPGGDYTSAPVANGDPTVCAARCERDKSCRAWSFSYPSITGGPAMCWLKREVVPAKESSCCVSGVRGAGVVEPRALRRRLSLVRNDARCQRQSLRGGVPKRAALPGLDVSPARLWRRLGALLSQGCDQAAAASAVLHFRRGAVKPCHARRKRQGF